MDFTYYVRLEYPEFPEPENPAGIYRHPKNDIYGMEAFTKNLKWEKAPGTLRKFVEGDTMTYKEVSEETAKKAVKNTTKKLKESV